MKRLLAGAIAAAVLSVPSTAAAQNPMMDSVKAQFGVIKGYLLKTAEKVPEATWSFQPTPEVRTFGQIVGHIADANLMICGAAAIAALNGSRNRSHGGGGASNSPSRMKSAGRATWKTIASSRILGSCGARERLER